ncbi:MAG: hypothetical protein RLZZ502_1468 [Pseudomonadota bacterium]
MNTLANAIRFLAIDAIVKAGEGHQGVPLGMAEIATALFTEHFKCHPKDPLWPDRDRFVLSNGHGSMLLYAVLYLLGYEKISLDEIKRFRELGSHCAGHPEIDQAAGIEVTTGLLGQGIANAFGMAIAEAHLNARYGDAHTHHHTYCFVGDGCLQEGIGQEVISLAGHLQLSRFIVLWDHNLITDDGATALSISEDVAERCRVAGWHVEEVDGHDVAAVSAAIARAKADKRPSFIACRTRIAKGLARLEAQRGGHSARLFAEDAAQARQDLQWPHAEFEVPEEVLTAWRQAGARHANTYQNWQATHSPRAEPCGDADDCLVHASNPLTVRGRMAELNEILRAYKVRKIQENKAEGGINLSGEISDLLALPNRLIACADLEAPTAHKRTLAAFDATNRLGQYVHFGVREHVMGAAANGMAAHGGVHASSVTYLAFSDYQRPALRMAALMKLPVVFVFSHDSIGIGKNGPTHQPVEILASLRAMPNMLVLRPADAIEMAECWAIALAHKSGPVSLICARQALPLLRQDTAEVCQRGAYLIKDVADRHITLLATGSEVAIAVQAAAMLASQGVAAAVVSMPSWELFAQQSPSYQQQVLGVDTPRIAIEAACQFGWERWLTAYTDKSFDFVGMSDFGLSGASEALYQHFGITAENAVAKALALIHF